MDNTAITLKFGEKDFESLQEMFAHLDSRLSAIGMIDLSGVSDNVSYGHYLLVEDVIKDLRQISQSINASIV